MKHTKMNNPFTRTKNTLAIFGIWYTIGDRVPCQISDADLYDYALVWTDDNRIVHAPFGTAGNTALIDGNIYLMNSVITLGMREAHRVSWALQHTPYKLAILGDHDYMILAA